MLLSPPSTRTSTAIFVVDAQTGSKSSVALRLPLPKVSSVGVASSQTDSCVVGL